MSKSALSHNTPENVNRLFSDQGYVKRYLSNERLAWYGEMIDLFADEAGIDFRNRQIADVGCGTGHALKYVHDNFDHGPLFGYDYSVVALKIARKTLPIGQFVLHDISIPLNRMFDIILGLELFEHLHKPLVVLDNLRAAIHNDGLIFLAIPEGSQDRYAGHIHKWTINDWMEFSGASIAGISNAKRSPSAGPVIWSILEKEP